MVIAKIIVAIVVITLSVIALIIFRRVAKRIKKIEDKIREFKEESERLKKELSG